MQKIRIVRGMNSVFKFLEEKKKTLPQALRACFIILNGDYVRNINIYY